MNYKVALDGRSPKHLKYSRRPSRFISLFAAVAHKTRIDDFNVQTQNIEINWIEMDLTQVPGPRSGPGPGS